jgi:recombination associated protein RdgC
MVVDTSSAKVAEDFASALRKSIGSLPVRPLVVNQSPAFTFTGWLNESIDLPSPVKLGSDCLLEDPSEDGGKLTAKGMDLESDELRNYIASGMHATRISVEWEENLSFVLDSELTISKLQFGDAFHEKLNDVDADDALARFDAAFGLMTLELSRLLPGLLGAFGGEDLSAIIDGEPVALADSQHLPHVDQEVSPGNSEAAAPTVPNNLYKDVEAFVVEEQQVSISRIQRKFQIGYNRAANLVDELSDRGVVSSAGHNGGRRVLMSNICG